MFPLSKIQKSTKPFIVLSAITLVYKLIQVIPICSFDFHSTSTQSPGPYLSLQFPFNCSLFTIPISIQLVRICPTNFCLTGPFSGEHGSLLASNQPFSRPWNSHSQPWKSLERRPWRLQVSFWGKKDIFSCLHIRHFWSLSKPVKDKSKPYMSVTLLHQAFRQRPPPLVGDLQCNLFFFTF